MNTKLTKGVNFSVDTQLIMVYSLFNSSEKLNNFKGGHMEDHRCIHGEKHSTFHAVCLGGYGNLGWRRRGEGRCPYQWYMGDCPKYESSHDAKIKTKQAKN